MDDKTYDELNEVTKNIVKNLEFMLNENLGQPVVLKSQEYIDKCDNALYCLQKINRRKSSLYLGQVVDNLPKDCYGSLRPNEIILYEFQRNDKLTIEVPWSKGSIDRKPWGLVCSQTIVNVPQNMIRPIYGILSSPKD